MGIWVGGHLTLGQCLSFQTETLPTLAAMSIANVERVAARFAVHLVATDRLLVATGVISLSTWSLISLGTAGHRQLALSGRPA